MLRRRSLLFALFLAGAFAAWFFSRPRTNTPIEFAAMDEYPAAADGPSAAHADKASAAVPCPKMHAGLKVILVVGQSQAANSPDTITEDTRYKGPADAHILNLNVYDGKCYVARDPLLGATGQGGSLWLRLAHHLIATGKAREVVLMPIAVGGTSISEWVEGGRYHRKLIVAIHHLHALNLAPSDLYWMQGATDAINKMPAEQYRASLQQLIQLWRQQGWSARVWVAQDTICRQPWLINPKLAKVHQSEEDARQAIRAGQRGLAASGDALAGIDLDNWGISSRPDQCHLGTTAIDQAASAIAQKF